ncbi:PREDICTED: uncharacterized protein LOC109155019 [Ipomoea nil]|uniref:uncharacterized protein LOC109155019 n=1 Tax=Ipomoea nil TaxID=35883 RepID=UPI0009011D6E|nr:PREDICTED: uncharacterized protein LOC109155019 [Ipomoea nil]
MGSATRKRTRSQTWAILSSQAAEASQPSQAAEEQNTVVKSKTKAKRQRTTRAVLNSQSAEPSQQQLEELLQHEVIREKRSKQINDRHKGKEAHLVPNNGEGEHADNDAEGSATPYFSTRMGPKTMFKFVQKLTPEQKQSVRDIGFGALLNLQLCTSDSQLVQYLLDNFELYQTHFKLENDKLTVEEEDIKYTLGIPRGEKVVVEGPKYDEQGRPKYRALLQSWRTRWNIKIGSPITTKMGDVIVKRGDYGDEFKRGFMVLTVSCMMRGFQTRRCNHKILNSLVNVDEIKEYNWCNYTYNSLIKSIKKYKKKSNGFFTDR